MHIRESSASMNKETINTCEQQRLLRFLIHSFIDGNYSGVKKFKFEVVYGV